MVPQQTAVCVRLRDSSETEANTKGRSQSVTRTLPNPPTLPDEISCLHLTTIGERQDALAARFPTNPLLQVRGNAGTHDLALALRTIRALTRGDDGTSDGDSRDLRPSPPFSAEDPAAQDCVRVPRYDKSARGGKGDRAPEGEWSVVSTPPDVLLLEGWMLGFEALPDDSPLLLSAAEADGGE